MARNRLQLQRTASALDSAAPPPAVGHTPTPAAEPLVTPLLVPASVAGPMCGRSEASWWRDHAALRVPAPVKLGGRTLWRVEELRRWVESGCPARPEWETRQAAQAGGRPHCGRLSS
jgi:predicted DNA-binding transcriptional regulator AlpA